MANNILTIIITFLMFGFYCDVSHALSRIKDMSYIEGVRDNQLIGYGLVVGLSGTGDRLNNSPFTEQSLKAMLERFGVSVRGAGSLSTVNVAAVVATGVLPAFATQGTHIDVTVSALGDSTSLEGGTLLVTPMLGADGEVYAVAQGSIVIGGFNVSGQGASVRRGVATTGRIANGAIIESEMSFGLEELPFLRLSLYNPDFTTVRRMTEVINSYIGEEVAVGINASVIRLTKPKKSNISMNTLITEIERLLVEPDQPARVVIDEKSGIIVMGRDVRISKVAIAQGNLTVRIVENPKISQPSPFTQNGETTIVPQTNITIDDGRDKQIAVVKEQVTLEGLVTALNSLGVPPRDIISILQSIKAAGALHAKIEVL